MRETLRAMEYNWINPEEIIDIDEKKLVLFGAGKGSEEFFQHLKQLSNESQVVAITDNDSTYWGKTLDGYEIVSPESLLHMPFDKIVVSSVSGREVIANQLERMGFSNPRDYILIGRFPPTYRENFKRIENLLAGVAPLTGTECLHIGPGGFLGLETLLYSFGASRVRSIDKFSFGIHYPNISPLLNSYTEVKESISVFARTAIQEDEAHRRFDQIFYTESQNTYIDSEKIEYTYPADICSSGVPDSRFDLVLSFGVLEHVSDPATALSEITRCTRLGGTSLHLIVTRDHRSNSGVNGNSPFAFRSHSYDEWEAISNQKFYQNRLLPIEWFQLFEKNGFTIQRYEVYDAVDIDDRLLASFHSDFNRFSRTELGEVDCLIVAKKSS